MAPPRPTEAELAILGVLWDRGCGSVREVHEALEAERGTGYTTVLKLMQIMVDKGLLERDASQRQHVFTPAVSRVDVQGELVDDLRRRAFRGSTGSLVLRALSSGKTSPEELAEIEVMLRRLRSTSRTDEEA